jgi:hypothetical protein
MGIADKYMFLKSFQRFIAVSGEEDKNETKINSQKKMENIG